MPKLSETRFPGVVPLQWVGQTMTAFMFSRLPDQKTSQIPSGLPHRPSATKHDEAWRSMTNWWFKCRSSIRPWVDLFAAPTFHFFLSIVNNNSVYVAVCFGICFTMPYQSSLWAISIWKVDDLPVPASSPNVTICHNLTMVWQNLKMFNCLKPKGLPRHFPWPPKHFPYSCGQNRCSLPQKAPLPTAGQLIFSASTGVYRVIKDSTS